MSTHDDGTERGKPGGSLFEDTGYTPTVQTSLISDVADPDSDRDTNRWHGGLDLGLLVLRLGLGCIIGAHGLQKLFGAFDGPGINGFSAALGQLGFTSQTTLLSWITALTESISGLLLVLGLFTPFGAAGVLGVMGSVVYLKFKTGFLMTMTGGGFEYELLLGLVALALLFTGSGRIALDVNTPWRRKPVPLGVFGLLLAAAASVVILIVFR
ncbi:DoxX family protein [Amycolatopsis suaedae]|uniref:DoxX family protein n=1 Tax=Amycolatopsis suaedae TaxID=2510978 RepID=UPI0026B23CD4